MNPWTCDNAVTNTGLLYLEKRFPEIKGHPPSRINFNERVFEKKYIYIFQRVYKVFIWRNVGPAGG